MKENLTIDEVIVSSIVNLTEEGEQYIMLGDPAQHRNNVNSGQLKVTTDGDNITIELDCVAKVNEYTKSISGFNGKGTNWWEYPCEYLDINVRNSGKYEELPPGA